MRLDIQQTIYRTCDSIGSMVELCLRVERQSLLYASQISEDDRDFKDLWEKDIPELLFLMLDFIWTARIFIHKKKSRSMPERLVVQPPTRWFFVSPCD